MHYKGVERISFINRENQRIHETLRTHNVFTTTETRLPTLGLVHSSRSPSTSKEPQKIQNRFLYFMKKAFHNSFHCQNKKTSKHPKSSNCTYKISPALDMIREAALF